MIFPDLQQGKKLPPEPVDQTMHLMLPNMKFQI